MRHALPTDCCGFAAHYRPQGKQPESRQTHWTQGALAVRQRSGRKLQEGYYENEPGRDCRRDGCRRGIGSEIVRQLAARGVTVVLTARKPAAGATAAATLASEALRVDFHPLSVTDEASIRALRAWFAAVFAARPKV